MDERKLVAAAVRGDLVSFNQLVRTYQSVVYQTAYHLLGDTTAATEVTQLTFVSARKQLRTLRGVSLKVWLLRLVFRACGERSGDGLTQTRPDPSAALQTSLQDLPLLERATVILADVQGLTYSEIAQITGTNIETVQARLGRARAQLRDVLFAKPEIRGVYSGSHAYTAPAR